MTESRSASGGQLPDFRRPPVVEVAVGVQFHPLFTLRPVELAPLRETWREAYPLVQEQPPVPPSIEAASPGSQGVQLVVGPAMQSRLWFLNEEETELVQLQHDRLTVNWRQVTPGAEYPRYPSVRQLFAERFGDVSHFVEGHHLGRILITQAEITYVNAIDLGDDLGRIDRLVRNWGFLDQHHLGSPAQARVAMVFNVSGVGTDPVRMYVAVDPAQRHDGQPVAFFTLTVRGAPSEDTIEAALRFMDDAHGHVVRSFVELTSDAMHLEWERQE